MTKTILLDKRLAERALRRPGSAQPDLASLPDLSAQVKTLGADDLATLKEDFVTERVAREARVERFRKEPKVRAPIRTALTPLSEHEI